MRHYCTYFDARYLPRALALYASLRRHEEAFTLHALCLDAAAHSTLLRLAIPNLRPISLRQLTDAYPQLLEAQRNRSLVEFYFTCSPALPLYVMDHTPMQRVDLVTYLDADLYFFDTPEAVFRELGTGSVAIVEHRYPRKLEHLAAHGKYNVGWVSFRNDTNGRASLRWWFESCVAWCYERVEQGRYADQGYLNDFPRMFAGVVSIQNRGANAAPWNLAGARLGCDANRVTIDGDPLVFYHFHRLKIVRPYLFDPGLDHYGVEPNPIVTRRIYGPYLQELRALLSRGATGNLRLSGPQSNREVLRLVLYGRTLLQLGSVTREVHGEPLVRPLLRLREWMTPRKAA